MLFAFTAATYQSLGSSERTTLAEAFGDLYNNCQLAPDRPSSVRATLVVALGFVAAPGDSADIREQLIGNLICYRNLSKQTD